LNVRVVTLFHIGKESDLLEEQEKRVPLTDPQAVYAGGDDWEAIRPWLDWVSISKLAARSGVSPRMLRNLRQGHRRPSAQTLEAITEALIQRLDEAGGQAPDQRTRRRRSDASGDP
jgi:transcriptional regulator with XRE-family HTH domain